MRLDAKGDWARLAVSAAVSAQLRELENRCRHALVGHAGWEFRATTGHGVRALFSGPDGTGKTLAAEVLAARLGRDLHRVDLNAVVNKYIGETEKNLRRVFDRAERHDAVLLFDEADALFAKRMDVRDAHDRYANLEANYLLQRIEDYKGTVVLATNLHEKIDSALTRRMDMIVEFPLAELE